MKKIHLSAILSIAAGVVALTILSGCSSGGQAGQASLPRGEATEEQTASFDRMFNDIAHCGATSELHDLIVVKDGKVIYERYDPAHTPENKHVLWSASKTFTATAIGFAVQDGLLSLEDPITKFFKDEIPENHSDTLEKVTVWNLLTMSSGFKRDLVEDAESLDLKNPAAKMMSENFQFFPGDKFNYNSMNTYLLSAIVTKLTGMTAADYLDEKLFKPLGITDWYWKESAEGYSMGGWGLFLRPEDFTKMGVWMLQKGVWNGKRLLNEEWFDQAMSKQIYQTKGTGLTEEEMEEKGKDNDYLNGYGYQMWISKTGAARLDGAWCQYCVICPDKNAVITVNSVCTNGFALLDFIWKNVYDKL